MFSNNSGKVMRASLQALIYLFGIISLFAIPASAQHVHQLLYNNYNWSDQNLAGEPVLDVDPLPIDNAAFTTTPNNQLHVYYIGSDNHIHQRTQSQMRFFGLSGP